MDRIEFPPSPKAVNNSMHSRFSSEWAFGLNRRIGSVCSVAVNFGFHRSTTDRFAIESKTDEFGVGFVGSTEPTEASTEEQINRENGEREKNKSTRKGRRCRTLRCPHRRNPARRSRLRAPSSPIRLPGAAARRAAAHAATDSPSLASRCRRPRLLIHRKPPTAAACHCHSPMRTRRPQLLPEPMRGFPPQPLPPRCALTDRPQ